MADTSTQVVKQPANSATATRTAAVAGSVIIGPQVFEPVVEFFAQIMHNLSPEVIPLLTVSQDWSVATIICGLPAIWAAFSLRGSTVTKDT